MCWEAWEGDKGVVRMKWPPSSTLWYSLWWRERMKHKVGIWAQGLVCLCVCWGIGEEVCVNPLNPPPWPLLAQSSCFTKNHFCWYDLGSGMKNNVVYVMFTMDESSWQLPWKAMVLFVNHSSSVCAALVIISMWRNLNVSVKICLFCWLSEFCKRNNLHWPQN